MKKMSGLIIVLLASMAGLAASLAWLGTVYPVQARADWMSQMMSRMIGGGFGSPPQATPVPFYMVALPFALLGLAVAAAIGVTYFVMFPEIRRADASAPSVSVRGPALRELSTSLDVVMRALKPDERRVVEILRAHEGMSLQKDIAREAQLSRLKIHRIVARLVERGIVTVREHGRTNEVRLVDWLHPAGKDSPAQT